MAREGAVKLAAGLAAVGLVLLGGRIVQLLWGGAALAARKACRPGAKEQAAGSGGKAEQGSGPAPE